MVSLELKRPGSCSARPLSRARESRVITVGAEVHDADEDYLQWRARFNALAMQRNSRMHRCQGHSTWQGDPDQHPT